MKLNPSIRMIRKGNLSNFGCGVAVSPGGWSEYCRNCWFTGIFPGNHLKGCFQQLVESKLLWCYLLVCRLFSQTMMSEGRVWIWNRDTSSSFVPKGAQAIAGSLPAVPALPDFPTRASLLWICPQWFSNSLVFWSRCRHTIPNPYPWREVVQISLASGRRWPHMQTPHRQASNRWWIWTQEHLVLRQKC